MCGFLKKIPFIQTVIDIYDSYKLISQYIHRLDKLDDRLSALEKRMEKIEQKQYNPAYHCTYCKAETRVLLATRDMTGQLTGIYYCKVCERVSELPTAERITMQNAQTVEIINKLKEQGYNFNDTQWSSKRVPRKGSSNWDVMT